MAARPPTEPPHDHEPPARPRSRWPLAALALAGITLFAAFIALGTWQVQRRAWKLDLIARVEQRIHAAPVPLGSLGPWANITTARHEYQPVQIHGRLLADRTLLSQAATELGAGFWVMTPLRLPDGSFVWINRGFVPASARQDWAAPRAPGADATTITGLLRMNEPGGGFLRRNDPQAGRWHSRDVLAMSAAQGLAPAAPFFIDAGLPGQTAAPADGPRPGMTVVRFHNSHAVYALTWYGLALMVASAAWIVARSGRRHGA
ncbi:MAG: SURF1 family protein [Ottowia sp.]|uniref:SURF1 family protein n=1 Tax=Ottowia sp. TaxID=1898956 RepID=UPI0039E69EFB